MQNNCGAATDGSRVGSFSHQNNPDKAAFGECACFTRSYGWAERAAAAAADLSGRGGPVPLAGRRVPPRTGCTERLGWVGLAMRHPL